MIHTSKQLKDRVRNISKGDNNIAKVMIRNFIMERFLERVSVSDIMIDFEYPGIRMMLEAVLDRMRQVIKIDISTDDVITPSAVEYEYKLMFEDRTIPLLTYNIETLLAEKMQTILARGIANTRLRDFYDVHEIMKICPARVDKVILLQAFIATCKKRETEYSNEEILETLTMIGKDARMAEMWEQFRKRNYFVGDLEWKEVLNGVLDAMNCMRRSSIPNLNCCQS